MWCLPCAECFIKTLHLLGGLTLEPWGEQTTETGAGLEQGLLRTLCSQQSNEQQQSCHCCNPIVRAPTNFLSSWAFMKRAARTY